MLKPGYFFILLPVIFSALLLQGCSYLGAKNNDALFNPVESTIAQLQQALIDKSTSCVAITQAFLQRIKHYDKSTKLNAIILLNPDALNKARLLDEEFVATGKLRPLHCVPVILKDNYDTADMVTEAGAIALKGSTPPDDAFMVKKLRDAGAIILAKSNMGSGRLAPITRLALPTVKRAMPMICNAYLRVQVGERLPPSQRVLVLLVWARTRVIPYVARHHIWL